LLKSERHSFYMLGLVLAFIALLIGFGNHKRIQFKAYESPYKLQRYQTMNFKKENLHQKSFYMEYEDELYYTIPGIDVSEHNREIDWQKVAKSGIKFAFIRIGFRGYGSGDIYLDSTFEANYKGATANGIKVGVYFFSQAINMEEAKQEAQFVLKALNGRALDLAVVYDMEVIYGDEARTDNLTSQNWNAHAIAFCETVKHGGYRPMIYTNLRQAHKYYDYQLINRYPLWMAQYHEEMEYEYPVHIWQYSDTGAVPGINTYTDLNMYFLKKQK